MADDIQRSLEGMSLNRQQQAGFISQINAAQSPPMGSMSGLAPSNNDLQSASARFEHFFNNNPSIPNYSTSPTFSDQHSSNSYQQQMSPSSFGPSSSAAGLASTGAFGSFGHTFNSGGSSNLFNQNTSISQTVPALRTRTNTARQGLPSQWGTSTNEDIILNGSSPTGGYNGSNIPNQYISSATASSPSVPSATSAAIMTSSTIPTDDDIIPTAIVVKNIPFSIKKEQLLQIIEDLQIPMPYAFNYHFDQGVFRGLAFANFRSGEEADAVVAALNGFDVSGRKLRVEYKKVLQAGEKERIEKEKAIKRMQSMQLEKERERMRKQTGEEWNPSLVNNISSLPSKPVDTESPYVDYANADAGSSGRYLADTQDEDISADASDLGGGKKEELDLNDSATLEIYSRVLLFKDDRMRDELSFSKNLTTAERRIVHMVSKKLGLYHYSIGDGEERHVVVTKSDVEKGTKSGRSPASTIGRSSRGESNATLSNNGMLTPGSSLTTGRSGLRTKKSAPDMKRSRDRIEEGGFGGLSNNFIFGSTASSGSSSNTNSVNSNIFASNGGNNNLGRKSNGNLREGYSATTSRRPHSGHSSGGIGGAAGLQSLFASPFDVPPVPSLPTNPSDSISNSNSNTNSLSQSYSQSPLPSPIGGQQFSSNGGSMSSASSQHILRQPAGPGGNNRNFAQRNRVPLHSMQQSSNNTSGIHDMNNGSNGNGNSNLHLGLGGGGGSSYSSDNAYGDLDDRFGTLGNLTDDDVRTHEPLEV